MLVSFLPPRMIGLLLTVEVTRKHSFVEEVDPHDTNNYNTLVYG